MKAKRQMLLATLAVFTVASFAPAAWAQTQATSGDLQGVIVDPDGEPLPGVTVTATNEQTGQVRTSVTSNTGTYRIPLLRPGQYTVRAELAGFQPVEFPNITVSLGSAVDIDVQMQLESVQEVLVVTGQAPVIETSKTQVSTTVPGEAIESLPILGRDFTDFTLLTPGALIESSRETVALSGQRGINTSVNIDGTSSNSAFFGYQRGGTDAPFTVSQESVQEFQVITSGIMPEFGRSGGGLVNVITKSGTNQWRASAHTFIRNESLVADDPFGREQTEFHSTQFGGSLGGPIAQNETFFFTSADVQDFSTPFFVDLELSDTETAALQDFVAQHRPDWNIGEGRFSRTNDALVLFGKIDQSLGENHQLSVRANYSDHETINGGTDTGLQGTTNNTISNLGDQTEQTWSVVGQLQSVLGERAFNEFRVQWANDDLNRFANDLQGPHTSLTSLGIDMGRTFFMPIFVDEEKWQVQNNFSYLFDDHDIKAGFDIETDATSEFFAGFAAGWFFFSGLDSFLANEPLFLLQSFNTTVSGDPTDTRANFDARQTVASAYIQDSWRVNDSLTVNYGLRWEGTFNPTPPNPNPALPVTAQIPDDTDNFQPRVGLAYAPTDKTVFRASAGLFYARTPTLLFFNPFTSVGLPGQGVFFFPGFGALDGQWPNAFDSLPQGVSTEQEIYWFDPEYEETETLRINAGVEHEIMENFSLGASYVFARGNGLQALYDNNLVSGGRDENGRLIYSGRVQPGVQWRIDRSNAESRYHAGILEFKKRFSGGWGAFGSYTIAWDKDHQSQERSASGEQPTNIFNLDDDWGFADRSIRHRVVATAYGELPGDIHVAGVLTWRTGTPYNAIVDGNDLNNDGDNENDRPVINGQVVERNAFRQPDFKNLDIRVAKEIDTSVGSFKVLFEVFNVFNWDNLFTTRNEFNSDRFGVLNTFIGNTRQIQLGFRWQY